MKLLLIILLSIIEVSVSFGQQNWKLVKKDQGIEVFTTEINNSKYVAFKAITSIKTTENEILKILKTSIVILNGWRIPLQ